jgi:hypothetical protein
MADIEIVASHEYLCPGIRNFQGDEFFVSPSEREPVIVDVARDGRHIVSCRCYRSGDCQANKELSEHLEGRFPRCTYHLTRSEAQHACLE